MGIFQQMQVWDTAGQERFRSISTSFYRGAQCVMIVYDSSQPDTFAHLGQWLEDIRNHGSDQLEVLIVANKCDLLVERVDPAVAKEWAQRNGCDFIQSSAKNSINVDQAFEGLANKFIDKSHARVLEDTKKAPNLIRFPVTHAPVAPPKSSLFAWCSIL